jgi:hypothetical protein
VIEFVGLTEEMIAALSVEAPANESEAHWKVTRVEVDPSQDNMSAWCIAPKGLEVEFFWIGGSSLGNWKENDPYVPEQVREGAYEGPMFGTWGSYGFRVVGNSEAIFGFGLYGDDLNPLTAGHNPVFVTFEWYEGTEPPPPPPPPPPPGEARLVTPWMEEEEAATVLEVLRATANIIDSLTIESSEQ